MTAVWLAHRSVALVLVPFLSQLPSGQGFSDTQVGLVLALSICVGNAKHLLVSAAGTGMLPHHLPLFMEAVLMTVAGALIVLGMTHPWRLLLGVSLVAFGVSGEMFSPREEVRLYPPQC